MIAITAALDKEAQSRTGAGATAIIYRADDICGLEENSPKPSAFAPKARRKCISGHSEVEFAERRSQDSTMAAPFLCMSAKAVLPMSCKGMILSPWSLQVQSCAISTRQEEGCPGIMKRLATLQGPCCPCPIAGAMDTGLSPA